MSQDTLDPTDSNEQEAAETRTRASYFEDLKGQFIMLPMEIMTKVEMGGLTPLDACLYAYCLAKAGTNGRHWWSNDMLAVLTGWDVGTIKKSLTKLEKAGLIRRDRVKIRNAELRYIHPLLWVDENSKIVSGRSKADNLLGMLKPHSVENVGTIPLKRAA